MRPAQGRHHPGGGARMPWWRHRWAPWALLAAAFASAVPTAFALYAAGPKPGDAGVNCGGIGFGEVPCGWDAVGFVYVLFGAPLGLAFVLLLGLLELSGERGHTVRLAFAAVAVAVPWMVTLLALAGA